jgi:putative DNA primase/helicase
MSICIRENKIVRPNKAIVAEIVEALKPASFLERTVQFPSWLRESSMQVTELIPFENALLHYPSRRLLSHTPAFFGHNVLPYAYDANAPPPARWLAFVEELWPNDPESRDTFQEICGYLVSPETRRQKMFMIIGRPRSGKGTICRLLKALLGPKNVVFPKLDDLGERFGCVPLIHKKLACISEARLAIGPKHRKILECLLSITGEDDQIIDVKYKPQWKGRLGVRFLIISNEKPLVYDHSGALESRLVTLKLTQSFLNKEDLQLDEKLLAERSGIMNWALDGLDRLNSRGHFLRPETGRQLEENTENKFDGSLYGFFITNCVDGPSDTVEPALLYRRYEEWAKEHGMTPMFSTEFFQGLHVLYPSVETIQPRSNNRRRVYVGIGLKVKLVSPMSNEGKSGGNE